MSANDQKPHKGEKTGVAVEGPTAAPEASAPGPAAEPTANDEIAKLRADLAAAQDLQLRALAELDNYRKRAAREMQEQLRYAQLPLMRDVLPVLDNIQRAIDAAEKTHDTAALLDGITLVAQQLRDVLKRHHCTPIEALHAPFDPHVHEAILQQPSAELPPNTVVQEVRPGYRLFDRVVRPSQVIVSTKDDEARMKDE
jgi:molecular chaperone GrpE